MISRRILILTNRIPYPLHDGGALAMDAMIRGYHAASMQVYLLAMNTTRHLVADAILQTLYLELEGFEVVEVDNRIKPLQLLGNLLFNKEPAHVQRFHTPAYMEALTRVIQYFQPDIIQIESPFLSAYLPQIRSLTKAVVVLRMHNIEYQIWERLAGEGRGWKQQYLRVLATRMKRYEERIFGAYDLLLPITDMDADKVHALYPQQRLVVAPFGIAINNDLPGVVPAFTRAYHLGAMDWLPNSAAMDWLLQEIWPEVQQQVPQMEFYFAGRHMPDRFFKDLPPQTYCMGEVADATAFVADKQILLVPLRAGGGIRVKILEAMAAGKLVVSTDIGMQGIAAIPGVHYLPANTPCGFAEQLKWVVDHPAKARAIMHTAQQFVQEQYSQAAVLKNVLDALDQLLKE